MTFPVPGTQQLLLILKEGSNPPFLPSCFVSSQLDKASMDGFLSARGIHHLLLTKSSQADPSPVLREALTPLTCSHELLHICAVLEHNAVMGRFHQLKEKTLGSCICVTYSQLDPCVRKESIACE